MKKMVLFSLITIALVFSASFAAAKNLPAMKEVEKDMFKSLAKQNINPVTIGWGIGLNTANDSYLVARFYAVSTKIIPRNEILQILKDARASNNITTWADVAGKIKAAIASNATTAIKGRIQINKEQYILTGVVRNETAFSGDIRSKPDYNICVASNVSAEDCEAQSAKVGDLSLARKTAEVNAERHKIWAGALNFSGTAYTFVTLVNP